MLVEKRLAGNQVARGLAGLSLIISIDNLGGVLISRVANDINRDEEVVRA